MVFIKKAKPAREKVSLRLDPSQVEALNRLVEAKEMSASELIRAAVAEYLDRNIPTRPE